MANLKATTTGLVSEKIGTTPADVESNYGATDTLGSGFTLDGDVQYGANGSLMCVGFDYDEMQRRIEYDPHNANRFVVVYATTSYRHGAARIGIVNGDQITYSNEYKFRANATYDVMFAFDPSVANKFVVVWMTAIGFSASTGDTIMNVGTISYSGSDPTGFQITFGADQQHIMSANVHLDDIAFCPNTPGRFCFSSIYWWGNLLARGVIVAMDVASSGTGTTISGWGSDYEYSYYGWSQRESKIAFDPNVANKLVIVWNHGQGLNSGQLASAGTHLGQRTLTINSVRSFSAAQIPNFYYTGVIRFPAIAWDKHNTGKFAIVFMADDDGDRARIIFGTAESNGTFTVAGGDFAGAGWTSASRDLSIVFNPFYDQYFTSQAELFITYQAEDQYPERGEIRMNSINWTINGQTLSAAATFNTAKTLQPIISTDYKLPGRYIIGFGEPVSPAFSGKVIAGRMNQNKITMDLSTGSFFTLDMSTVEYSIAEFVTTSVAVGTVVTKFDLRVIQGGVARYFDWDYISNVKWSSSTDVDGTPPVISATDNAVDVYSFTTYDNGTTWYGEIVGQDIK